MAAGRPDASRDTAGKAQFGIGKTARPSTARFADAQDDVAWWFTATGTDQSFREPDTPSPNKKGPGSLRGLLHFGLQ